MNLDSKIPAGPLAEKWTNYKASQKLVNPANKRKLDIIVVGTGLAGASAAASLGAMGFNVDIFCIQDSPRRAKTVDHFHKALGKIMWEYCGMARNTESLNKAKKLVSELEDEFWKKVFIPGTSNEFNPELEKAYRLEDYFELAQLVIDDAMHREESCGGHFRTEHQTEDGETLRDDEHFMYVAAWEYQGHGRPETMEKEPLVYEHIQIAKRNYK